MKGMKGAKSRIWSGILMLGCFLIHAPEASAYCILEERWTPPPGPIPVYVASGGGAALYWTGIGADGNVNDEIRWIKEAIAIINEGSHDAPRFYFAGTDLSVDYVGTNFWTSRNPGITVSTFGPCDYQVDAVVADFGFSGNKGAIRMSRGVGGADYGNGSDYSCPACVIENGVEVCTPAPHVWWTNPGDHQSGLPNSDMVGTLVHEFSHSLGLCHTDGSHASAADQAFPYLETAQSVMYTDAGWLKHWRRRLRKDDVDGLRALWGEPERTTRWAYSNSASPLTSSWSTTATVVIGQLTNTPMSLSNSTRGDDQVILAGFTASTDQIRYLTGSWSQSWPAASTTLPNPQGGSVYTYDHVAVARGKPYDAGSNPPYGAERRLVAWQGTDLSTCCGAERTPAVVLPNQPPMTDTRIWWRVHDGNTWLTPQSTATTKYKELGVGYDPREDLFVMAYIDTCLPNAQNGCDAVADHAFHQRLFVRTIKAWLGGGGCIQALTTVDHVLAVGNIACDYRDPNSPTRCVIPISTADEFGGPKLRFVEGEIKAHDGFICFVREVDPPTTIDVLALGTPGAAFDGYASPGRFVGSYVPGFTADAPAADDWSRLFRMSRDVTDGWLVQGTMGQEKAYPTNYWPISVGSITRTTGETHVQWRAISY